MNALPTLMGFVVYVIWQPEMNWIGWGGNAVPHYVYFLQRSQMQMQKDNLIPIQTPVKLTGKHKPDSTYITFRRSSRSWDDC